MPLCIMDLVPRLNHTLLHFDNRFDGDSVLDLRIYAKPRGRSSGESKDLAPNAVVAQFNFVGQGDRELTFSAGDVIVVEGQYDADWWKGYIGDRRGFFPANYVSGLEHVSDVAKVEDSTTNYQDAEYFDGYSHLVSRYYQREVFCTQYRYNVLDVSRVFIWRCCAMNLVRSPIKMLSCNVLIS